MFKEWSKYVEDITELQCKLEILELGWFEYAMHVSGQM